MAFASLVELSVNKPTDKNTGHSYLPLYDSLLSDKRESAKAVLEIGVFSGGSILLWEEYFKNADIVGMDIILPGHLERDFEGKRITTIVGNAYTADAVAQFGGRKFDLIVDDGPHSIQSMMFTIEHYSGLLADDGIMIIEDVQEIGWLERLHAVVPADLKEYATSYDLRANKNRYDDVVFVIDKRRKQEQKTCHPYNVV